MRKSIAMRFGAYFCALLFGVAPLANASTVKSTSPIATTTVCSTIPTVFYINGIMASDQRTIEFSAAKLSQKLDAQGLAHNGLVVPLYNPSEGLFLDIARKLLAQKVAERLTDIFVWLENTLNYMSGGDSQLTPSDQAFANQAMADATVTEVTTFADTDANTTLNKTTGRVLTAVNSGGKAVIVAHSEGNMFANAVYTRTQLSVPNAYNKSYESFDVSHAIQVVNVANPASSAATNKYITIVEDLVINVAARILAALTLTAQPMAANANPDPGLATFDYDKSGHGFESVYLNAALPVLNQVLSLVKSAGQDAQSFGAENSEGPIDLVAFSDYGVGVNAVTTTAPDGSVVTAVTTSGVDTQVFSMSCGALQEGTYHVAVEIIPGPSGAINGTPMYGGYASLKAPRINRDSLNNNKLLFQNSYYGSSPSDVSVSALDIVVTKDAASGGFKEVYFPYYIN